MTSTQLMLGLAGEYGLPLDGCLDGTHVTRAHLRDASYEIRGREELAVLRNILRALGPTAPFSIRAGLRYHPTSHGMWGFALLSAASAGASIEVSLRYWDLSYSFNQLAFDVEGKEARLIYDSSANPEDLQGVLVERDLAALATFVSDIHGGKMQLPPTSVQLRGERPPYAAELTALFGVEPAYRSDINCVTFSTELLSLRHPQADSFGLSVSEEQCRVLLERRSAQSGVSGRVRNELMRRTGEFPSMLEVAARLGVSTRTLHNQLVREGCSFRTLVEEVRQSLAEDLLASSSLTVDEIAVRLDYSDPSSFVAAFKRWKGVPPGEYKRNVKGSA